MLADSKPIPKPWKVPRNQSSQGHQNDALIHTKGICFKQESHQGKWSRLTHPKIKMCFWRGTILEEKARLPTINFHRLFGFWGVYFPKKKNVNFGLFGPTCHEGSFFRLIHTKIPPKQLCVCGPFWGSQFLLPYESSTKKRSVGF